MLPPTILMADDDPDDRMLMKEALEENELPHYIDFVVDGAELLDYLHKRGKFVNKSLRPNLIILDLNMPKVDGFKALQLIKKNLNLKDIPVYILSTSGDKFHIEKALNLGAAGYYRKSTKFDDIVTMVSEVCGRHNKGSI